MTKEDIQSVLRQIIYQDYQDFINEYYSSAAALVTYDRSVKDELGLDEDLGRLAYMSVLDKATLSGLYKFRNIDKYCKEIKALFFETQGYGLLPMVHVCRIYKPISSMKWHSDMSYLDDPEMPFVKTSFYVKFFFQGQKILLINIHP